MTTATLTAAPNETENHDLVITRIIDAPRERVFRAWTDSAQLPHWWGPHGMTTPVCEIDLRPGGIFRTVMRDGAGNEYPNAGHFVEIAEPERVSFTDKLDPNGQPSREAFMLATITFAEHGAGQTELTARARHYSEADCAKHEAMGFHKGWGEMLDRLSAFLAAAPGERVVTNVPPTH